MAALGDVDIAADAAAATATWMYARTHPRTHACMCARLHIRTYARIHMGTFARV